VTTPHGSFDTPAFMPVGSQASVKGLMPSDVARTGTQVLLANSYHLMLRPGARLIADMGGLHRWMRWQGPILTDSGGFQIFSLAHINRVTDEGVVFQSHVDGATIELTPQAAMRVQNDLGSDIIMAFDDCPPATHTSQHCPGSRVDAEAAIDTDAAGNFPLASVNPLDSARVRKACERSIHWLDRCVRAHQRPHDQALFGIIQGGVDLTQRSWCTQRVLQHDLPGYAIGGVAVGEGFGGLRSVVEHTAPLLPEQKPRYLMGVGYERDILAAVRAGVDMFDCVLPTRNGRNANAFTPDGQIRLRNARYARDPSPIDSNCDCLVCAGVDATGSAISRRATEGPFSRSYLRHLFQAGEMLGPILVSLHNIRHFQRFALDIRDAIVHNDWSSVSRRWPSSRLSDDCRPGQ
jgi:queuine tRNA-ribosyltransferase